LTSSGYTGWFRVTADEDEWNTNGGIQEPFINYDPYDYEYPATYDVNYNPPPYGYVGFYKHFYQKSGGGYWNASGDLQLSITTVGYQVTVVRNSCILLFEGLDIQAGEQVTSAWLEFDYELYKEPAVSPVEVAASITGYDGLSPSNHRSSTSGAQPWETPGNVTPTTWMDAQDINDWFNGDPDGELTLLAPRVSGHSMSVTFTSPQIGNPTHWVTPSSARSTLADLINDITNNGDASWASSNHNIVLFLDENTTIPLPPAGNTAYTKGVSILNPVLYYTK